MPTGLEIINDSGTVLIDQDYKNLSLVGAGVWATTSTGGGINGSFGTLTISGTNPIIAFRCDSTPVIVIRTSVSGSTFSYLVHTPEGAAGAHPIAYYIFDNPPSAGLNYGLQVFDAAGQLTFDSGRKYMRVVSLINHGWMGSSDVDYTFTPGRFYAFAFARPSYGVASGGGPTFFINIYGGTGARTIANGIRLEGLVVAQFSSSSAPFYNPPGAMLVIDVTNY